MVNPPDLLIYLKASVPTLVGQIQKRGREYELIVPREYWESLNHNYRGYFESYDISEILKINVDNLDFVESKEDEEYVLKLIDEKLKSI